jgi:prepilin-type N-terminal cleavage/methylation domain-containing protein
MHRLGQSSIRKAKATQGFTLVEALVGIVVVGIVMTGLYALMVHGMRTAQWAREDMRASQVLQEKLEKLRLYSWDQLTDTNTVPRSFVCGFNAEDPALGGAGLPTPSTVGASLSQWASKQLVFRGTFDIDDGPKNVSYRDSLKKVTVIVSWTSTTGLKRQRSVTTYFAQYGLQNYLL